MLYSLIVALTFGLLFLALLGIATRLARDVSSRGGVRVPALGGWYWYPSTLAFLFLLPLAAVVVARFLPALIVLPLALPFLFRRRAGLFSWDWGHRGRDDEEP